MSKSDTLEKCAAVILDDSRLLVVRKRNTAIFISPGGKRERSETEIECLTRELKEELSVRLVGARFFGVYERPSALESGTVKISVWIAEVEGQCVPSSEIEELLWITAGSTVPVGSVFSECVIPALVRDGLM